MSINETENGTRLGRDQFAHDPVTMAKALLGATLVRILDSGDRLSGVIVETEAYLGAEDKAAHSFGGRRTARNEVMYGPPGMAYIYFTYGMHHCVNVVCGSEGEPVAVLLRAIAPIDGVSVMHENRRSPRRSTELRLTDLCSGPAKLCQAMQIDRSLNGVDLVKNNRLFIEPSSSGHVAAKEIRRSARIGVAYAGDWAERPLRFHLANSPHVSRK